MNEPFDLTLWNVETTDLTARVAAAIGVEPSVADLVAEVKALRREIAELHATTAILQDEVARLRLVSPLRRIVPFGSVERVARLS